MTNRTYTWSSVTKTLIMVNQVMMATKYLSKWLPQLYH